MTLIRCVLALALGAAAFAISPMTADALTSPITIGNSAGPPGVTVDGSGTAYTAWINGLGKIDFCKLPLGSSGCSPRVIDRPGGSGVGFFGTPLVTVDGSDVRLYIDTDDPADSALTGLEEYLSTDGGTTFARSEYAVGYTGGYQPSSLVALPDGSFGVGWVGGGFTNPTFQANSVDHPTEYSASNAQGSDPYATLSPSPNNYALDDSSGAFSSHPTGSSAGVFGVFETGGQGPCTSGTAGLVYSFAALPATDSELDSNSHWSPLTKVDCTGTNPAVAAGPSGYGLLEYNSVTSRTQYRRFTPPHRFGAPVTVSSSTDGTPSLSQDESGRLYATWQDFYAGVQLAFSSDGGVHWVAGTLNSKATEGGSAASAVAVRGQGWVVYTEPNGHEYAQPFGPPAPDEIKTSQQDDSKHGTHLTVKRGDTGETDQATISGVNAGSATGTVLYALYSSASCTASSKVFGGATRTVHGGVAKPSKPVTVRLHVGQYYWRATYSGDIANAPGLSTCGGEVLKVRGRSN